MIASASADHYRRAIGIVAEAGVNAIIAIFVPPLLTRADEVATAIREGTAALQEKLPILTVFMSAHGMPEELRQGERSIPSYRFPEDAARALARAVQYGTWRPPRRTGVSPGPGGQPLRPQGTWMVRWR